MVVTSKQQLAVSCHVVAVSCFPDYNHYKKYQNREINTEKDSYSGITVVFLPITLKAGVTI
jgi:hypothetical protein